MVVAVAVTDEDFIVPRTSTRLRHRLLHACALQRKLPVSAHAIASHGRAYACFSRCTTAMMHLRATTLADGDFPFRYRTVFEPRGWDEASAFNARDRPASFRAGA